MSSTAVDAKLSRLLRPFRAVSSSDALLWLFLAALGYRYLTVYFVYANYPTDSPSFIGWLGGFDQGKYFEAAKSYAAWDFTAAHHYYPPGYALVVAPFIDLLGVHAFLPVDLISFESVAYFFVRVCDCLKINRLIAMALLSLSLVLEPAIFTNYVVPWNTTPVAALQTAVAYLFVRKQKSTVGYLLMGLLGGLVPVFRPSDIVPMLPIYLATAGQALHGRYWRRAPPPRLADVALAAGGGAATLAFGFLFYVCSHGLTLSPYLGISRDIGYDFSQLPQKLYVLFVDPISLYTCSDDDQCEAILHRMPWVALGLCGLVTAISRRDRAAVLALSVTIHLTLYAAYVDLIPTGLWRFGNIHYFIPVLPFLALFGWLFVVGLFQRRSWLRHGAVLAVAATLSGIHLDLTPLPIVARQAVGEQGFDLTLAESASVRVIDFPAVTGAFPQISFRGAELSVEGRSLRPYFDFRPIVAPWGARIVLLRPHNARHLAGRFLGKLVMPADFITLISVESMRLSYGLPRWWWPAEDRPN